MKIDAALVISFVIIVLICLLCSYLLARYIYGHSNPKKWKSILFTEKETCQNTLFPNKGKGKTEEENNSTQRISHNKTDEPDGEN